MRERSPRSLLRAALEADGWDAIGARTMGEALTHPPADPERGPVRLLIVDQRALIDGNGLFDELYQRHRRPPVLLIASHVETTPEGPWQVVRRPLRIGEVVKVARQVVSAADDQQPDRH
jgi:hypothetical protein